MKDRTQVEVWFTRDDYDSGRAPETVSAVRRTVKLAEGCLSWDTDNGTEVVRHHIPLTNIFRVRVYG
jgi:hypothetical protein